MYDLCCTIENGCHNDQTPRQMAAAGKPPKEKDPVNIVHQNAIHCETIRKEQRTQKLYTDYSVNPYKKRKCPPSARLNCEGVLSVFRRTDSPRMCP